MPAEYVASLLVSAVLLAYLVIALLAPERF